MNNAYRATMFSGAGKRRPILESEGENLYTVITVQAAMNQRCNLVAFSCQSETRCETKSSIFGERVAKPAYVVGFFIERR